jgi:hypothetical protein
MCLSAFIRGSFINPAVVPRDGRGDLVRLFDPWSGVHPIVLEKVDSFLWNLYWNLME